jgi:hypothetical protein
MDGCFEEYRFLVDRKKNRDATNSHRAACQRTSSSAALRRARSSSPTAGGTSPCPDLAVFSRGLAWGLRPPKLRGLGRSSRSSLGVAPKPWWVEKVVGPIG